MPEADILAAFPPPSPRRPRRVAQHPGSVAAPPASWPASAARPTSPGPEGRELLQEARIWDTGRPVPALGWRWRCRTQLVLSQCDVDVSYEASPGQTVTRPASALVFMGMDETPRPSCR